MEKELVNDFLQEHNFNITFPLNLIELAKRLEYSLYYISDKDKDYQDKAILVFTEDRNIFLNKIYRQDELWFLKGRYLIAKMLSHIALGNITDFWEENINQLVSQFNEEDKEKNVKATRFCFELLMPENIFLEQWNLLGGDKVKLSKYFGVSQSKVIERHIYLESKIDK